MPQTSPMNWMIMFSTLLMMSMVNSMILSKSFTISKKTNKKLVNIFSMKWMW